MQHCNTYGGSYCGSDSCSNACTHASTNRRSNCFAYCIAFTSTIIAAWGRAAASSADAVVAGQQRMVRLTRVHELAAP